MNMLGIMQGRLLPKYKGRYQAFPVDTWHNEFAIAKGLGLQCIEFILDRDSDPFENPLMNPSGLKLIQDCVEATGVKVITICADYFMGMPLFAEDSLKQKESIEVLKALLHSAKTLGVKDIVIPCVDDSSLKNDPVLLNRFKEALSAVIPLAESLGINLSLETDLSPKPFADLVKSFNSPVIKVNYDTGNSASLGYDVNEEMQAYGKFISTLHIKDRLKGGGSVILGQGNAQISLVLSELKKYHYEGPIILQAYRDDEGVEVFKQQLRWFTPMISQYSSRKV